MMDYKKIHKDIRYIVRNGQTDLKVLVKRISEGSRLPYREIEIKELGDISSGKRTSRGHFWSSLPWATFVIPTLGHFILYPLLTHPQPMTCNIPI